MTNAEKQTRFHIKLTDPEQREKGDAKMKWLNVVGLAAVVGVMSVNVVQAADAEMKADLLSGYVWRGQVLNDEPVLQPAFSVATPWGLSLNAWGNVELTDKYKCRGEFTEVDLTASYDLPIKGPVGVTVAVAEYLYPKSGAYEIELPENHVLVSEDVLRGEDSDSRDLSVTVTGDCLLEPTLLLSYDFDEVDGFYGSLGIGHSFEVMEKLSLDTRASIGYALSKYNEFYFGEDENAFNDGNVSAGLTYALTDNLSLSGSVSYSALLDSTIRDNGDEIYGYKDRVYGGFSAAYTF